DNGCTYVREWTDEKTGEVWFDEFTGPMRPLIGVDISASMYQIVAVVTGDRQGEQYLHDNDLKPAIMAALTQVDRHGSLQRASAQQLRSSAGVMQNTAYGQSNRSILKELKSNPDEYSDSWQDVSLPDFFRMLDDARKSATAVELLL